jgi:hypothetical protein
MQRTSASLSFEHLIFAAALAAVIIGLLEPMDRYLSPQSGMGYTLGIVGGSMMLLLCLYPLRKRFRALRFLGGVPEWFRLHMILGVLGPVCILFHSNFSLGATNSNVALFSMLAVAISGIVGRYLYTKIHEGLYGRKTTLAELKARGVALKDHGSHLRVVPEMVERIEREEQRMVSWAASPLGLLLAPVVLSALAGGARRRLRRYIRRAINAAAATSPALAMQRKRIAGVAYEYADRCIRASREVAEFHMYERMFSLWHLLHVPLFFLLLAAGIVHVVAVNVY